ncbi:tetratricopeptide repeat protein [Patescibacteria group bacterium]|nr:tetratricopeptide repeat protein [Patescibacteria group bacterium]
MTNLCDDAIKAALCNDWKLAVDLNTRILKEKDNEADVDCLNRLGKAYLELGDNKKAATIFRKVLKIDRYDSIATRNLSRALSTTPSKKTPHPACTPTVTISSSPNFLEEPGRTKLVALVNLAPMRTLLRLNQADQVHLECKRHTVVATDIEANYLGSLPDDLGHRLGILIKGGNRYTALVKSVSKSQLIIFIRELSRVKKFADTPSFVGSNQDYFSFIRDELLTETPPVTETEDDESSITSKLHADEEPEAT